MTGVKFQDPVYTIREQDNIIICQLPWDNTYFDCGVAIGVSKCNENDEFNVDIGKNVALTKAQRQAFKVSRNKMDSRIANHLKEIQKLTSISNDTKEAIIQCDFNLSKF